jgi:hypothetical protein
MLTCPYKAMAGIDCPGCGMQRSFIELLKGNFSNSLHLYPALLPVLFTLGLTAAHVYFKFKHGAAYVKYSFLITTGIIMTSYIYKMCG